MITFIFYLKGQSLPFWLALFFLLAFSFFINLTCVDSLDILGPFFLVPLNLSSCSQTWTLTQGINSLFRCNSNDSSLSLLFSSLSAMNTLAQLVLPPTLPFCYLYHPLAVRTEKRPG